MVTRPSEYGISADRSDTVTPTRLFSRRLRNSELRLLAPYDDRALLELINSDRTHFGEWLPWAREMHTVDDARAFIARGTVRYVEDGAPWLGVWVDGEMAGGVLFWPKDEMGQHIELGYWLSRRAGGRGVMTDVIATLVDFTFLELGLRKVVIKCAAGNEPSRGVPRRLGFQQEGLLRAHLVLDDQPHDLVVYGMLREDWVNRQQP